MSNFNIADVTDFLTPASVFTRQDGREARVLFLTNIALPEKLKLEFPPQVVYADENDNILSCGIERFLQRRKFFNVQPELEARLNNLLAAPSSDSGEDVLDLMGDDDGDDLTLTDDELDLSALEAEAGLGESEDVGDIDAQEPVVQFTARNAELTPVFDIDHLTAAVVSYQQHPSADLQATQHVLFIKAEAGINAATLDAVFSPANEGRNQTFEFAVDADGSGAMQAVNWDTFIGVYPCVFYGSRMYQVMFSVANVPAGIAEVLGSAAADIVEALQETPAIAAEALAAADAAVAPAAPSPAQAQAQATPIQVKVAAAPTAMQQAMAAAHAAQ